MNPVNKILNIKLQERTRFRSILFLSLFLLFFVTNNFAQTVIIQGNAPTYAGEHLIFYSYSDLVSNIEEKLSESTVKANGDYIFKLNIKETRNIFIPLEKYIGFIYVEPERIYKIQFPEKSKKTNEEKLNPFFEEINIHLNVKRSIPIHEININLAEFFSDQEGLIPDSCFLMGSNTDIVQDTISFDTIRLENKKIFKKIYNSGEKELNFFISLFNDYYNRLFDQYIVNEEYQNSGYPELVSQINILDSLFSGINNEYFKDYRKYKYGFLSFLAYQFNSVKISHDWFHSNGVLYNNTAYMDLFHQLYDKYILYFGRTEKGKKIYKDIGVDKSLKNLKATLGIDSVLANDTLKEMVILKCVHDEFYSDNFSRSALLQILDSMILRSSIKEHVRIAGNIRNKVTKLLKGFEPPVFELYDKENKLVNLSQFRGKYVYLNFCSVNGYSCLREFETMQLISEKYKDILRVVTISVDQDYNSLINFLDKSNYDWIFLHYGNNPTIIKDYDIRAYPTCYLIGPEGKLAMSPAPIPSERFEYYFVNLLIAKEKQKKSPVTKPGKL